MEYPVGDDGMAVNLVKLYNRRLLCNRVTIPLMNQQIARFNMIQQQIRPAEVLDQQVLDAMANIPREQFVEPAYAGLAYADIELPLPNGGALPSPKVIGRLAQALALRPTDKVLEIGTGGGYGAALLASLASHVYSIDQDQAMLDQAAARLDAAGIRNVTLVQGDGLDGLPAHAPYDAIAFCGSVAEVRDTWRDQLVDGGRLFVVVGSAPIMEAMLLTRVGASWAAESLFETELPALAGAAAVPEFAF
jgi:protein-L-isoaspartate(D-aspartate) O-methyltransferase